MNKMFRFFFLLILGLIYLNQSAVAGNVVAADLTYKHVSGQTYEITLTVFTECDPSLSISKGYQVDFQSISCGNQGKFNVFLESQKIFLPAATRFHVAKAV